MSKDRVQAILGELNKRQEENRLNYYQTYEFQKRFHKDGVESSQMLLIAANMVGKSYVGALEVAAPLTG